MLVNGSDEKAAFIIKKLKNSLQPVSGEELAAELAVSRVAVWKIIRKLENSGYNINSDHSGYTLDEVSDKPLPWEVAESPGKLRYYEETASTMKASFGLSGSESADGTIIIAGRQTEGISGNGGHWESPEGGIYFTRVRTSPLPCAFAEKYNAAAACAAAGVINEKYGITSSVKAPGEIIARDKKIGGVLTTFQGKNGTITRLSTGVGINVNMPAEDLPRGASSISELIGHAVSIKELVKDLLTVLEEIDSAFTDDNQLKIDDIMRTYS